MKAKKSGSPATGAAGPPTGVPARLFDGLEPRELQTVLAAAKARQVVANTVVTTQDHPASHLYLLTSGRARHFFISAAGRKNIFQWLTPGEVFGGASLLAAPHKYLVSTETVEDSSVLVWDRATIRGLAEQYPKVHENGALIAYDYLVWYLADHVALTSHSADERLTQVLICLSDVIGRTVPGGVEFNATNEELANAANISQFTASRLLSRWQRERVVVKRRGSILLLSPGRLLRKAET